MDIHNHDDKVLKVVLEKDLDKFTDTENLHIVTTIEPFYPGFIATLIRCGPLATD